MTAVGWHTKPEIHDYEARRQSVEQHGVVVYPKQYHGTGPEIRSMADAPTVQSVIAATQSPAYRQLAELSVLEPGWDGDEARSLTAVAVANTSYLIDLVRRATIATIGEPIEPASFVRLDSGGLSLHWVRASDAFDVIIGADGRIGLLEIQTAPGGGESYREQRPIEVEDAAGRIATVFAEQ